MPDHDYVPKIDWGYDSDTHMRSDADMNAAIAAIPPGMQWLVRTDEERGGFANVYRSGFPLGDPEAHKAYAPTPALALAQAARSAWKKTRV